MTVRKEKKTWKDVFQQENQRGLVVIFLIIGEWNK